MSGMWAKMRKNLLQMPIDSKEEDLTQIENNLYLGNIEFAQNQYSMKKFDISLIIGVYPNNLINIALQMIPSNCRFHHINAKDSPSEDLISHFDKCFDLITEEINENGGNVFVFCGAGISRSATIVASYLMRKHSIGCDEAIGRIKALRRKINPNQGFLGQLRLYEEMGCRLVRTNPEYRLFSLLLLKKQIWSESYWSETPMGRLNRQFCDPLRQYLFKLYIDSKDSKNKSLEVVYECSQCNHILFNKINVLFIDGFEDQIDCEYLFIEPIKWLTPKLCSSKKGDIRCPNCGKNLGKFKWKSFDCQCLLHNQLFDSKVIRINKNSVIRCNDK